MFEWEWNIEKLLVVALISQPLLINISAIWKDPFWQAKCRGVILYLEWESYDVRMRMPSCLNENVIMFEWECNHVWMRMESCLNENAIMFEWECDHVWMRMKYWKIISFCIDITTFVN
jgi:hypothetical protein